MEHATVEVGADRMGDCPLFELLDEGFCILEKVKSAPGAPLDFLVVHVNSAFASHTGLTSVVGKTIRQVFPTEEGEWLNTYERVFTSGLPNRFERSLASRGRVLELFAFRIEGQPHPQVGVMVRDITGRKRVEAVRDESEVRYRRLFETAKDGILILDYESGAIIDANPFMSDLLAYPTVSFCGKELWEIGLFKDKDASEAAVRQMQTTGFVRFEHLPLEARDGRQVEVEVVGNAYQEGPHSVMQCNIRDISERSRLERTTQEQSLALAELHKRKDEFLAMLSHELRTPLAPIANAAHVLAMQPTESAVQVQAREIIQRQVGQLKNLIDDLLEISRFTTGKVHLRRAPALFGDVVARGVEATRTLMEGRNHLIEVAIPDEPIWLNGDAARLEQVVVNLLANAAKYTEVGGRISVSVRREDNRAVLRVRDSGIGIAPELLPHIFDLFTQATRLLDRSQGGLGIGLCLVQRLVQLHDGTVEVTSVLEQGTEFVVRLPLVVPDALPMPATPAFAPSPGKRPCRVLVVDDSIDTAQSLAMLLRAAGHEVAVAYDGPTALEQVREQPLDIVLMDIGLPGLDGFEVATRVREDPNRRDLVLVAMTGYGQDADRRRSREAGFNHHLVKPTDLCELRRILAMVLPERAAS